MITFLTNPYFLFVQCPGLIKISIFLLNENCQLIRVPKTKESFERRAKFYWDDPYLFKYYPDQICQRCIPDNELSSVTKLCHSKACGSHFS